MAQNIETSIAALQAHALAIGLAAAPNTPPENAAVFPFSAAYEDSGELIQQSYKWGYDKAVIAVEFHIAHRVLNINVTQAYALRDAFMRRLISDPRLGGGCETTNRISRQFGRMEYNGVETVGYRWLIEVKIHLTGV